MAVVLNFSQMWALFCLVQFYNVTHGRLQSIKPLAKFISFKAIVFATWWQGVGIALLCSLGVWPKQGKFQTGLQDFLICIEVSRFFMLCLQNTFFLDTFLFPLILPNCLDLRKFNLWLLFFGETTPYHGILAYFFGLNRKNKKQKEKKNKGLL